MGQASWLTEWLLPAGVCAGVAWVGLVYRFREDGRLLGTARSAALAGCVVLWTSGVAALASGLLLPNASSVPPIAVGAVAGSGVVPRGRGEQTSGRALMAVLTLGDSLLLASLARRLQEDRADWCDRLVHGFHDCWDLDLFSDEVKRYLLMRVDVRGRTSRSRSTLRREILDRYKDVQSAAQRWAKAEADIGKTCLQQGRPRTREEERRAKRAFGEAEQYCRHLLELAHTYGKRSGDRKISELRGRHLPLRHTVVLPGVPRPRRRRLAALLRAGARGRGQR
ncbi:hypothetical protein [Streptomyces varsoviensis]|uniref:hypothetical protein n=1 Tax=Streptomyces varsoviensis TaxID=67373 RepID=UPI0012FF4B33|nr:hypothetical protein [Streptomyces varsoviensis]